MKEVIVNGKKVEINNELEKGELEFDLMNHELYEDTLDLSDAIVEVTKSLDDTNEMEIVSYE